MFKEAVDKYYNFFEVGKVYTIGGGKIKVANMKWNTCKSQYEMSLDVNSAIQLADDAGEIQAQTFDLVKIGHLEQVEPNKTVDVIGIVQEVSDVQSLMSKKTGQELQKADVTLIDDTGCQVRLTLWGNQAVNAPREIPVHKVVAFRRARVSDYGGVTLSGPQGVFVEPAIPETEALHDWWRSQGSRGAPVKSLSSSGGTGGKMDPFSERKSIADIKNLSLGYQNQEKGDYLCFKANFTFFKKDKEGGAWYTACPNKEDPCRNRCKVTQTTDGNWQCDRCHGTYPTCTRKWIFSGTVGDDSSSSWVSLFDDQALTLFNGATADEVFAQYENQDAYDGYFAKAQYTEWIFKCRVKSEMVNDEPRLKTTVVRMDPVDYVSESKDILAQLEKWQM
jgi:replication factor A1